MWQVPVHARGHFNFFTCFRTSTETVRIIRDGEPWTATSTFTQLGRSGTPRGKVALLLHLLSALGSRKYCHKKYIKEEERKTKGGGGGGGGDTKLWIRSTRSWEEQQQQKEVHLVMILLLRPRTHTHTHTRAHTHRRGRVLSCTDALSRWFMV